MSTSKLSGTGARRKPRIGPRHTWTTDQKRCLLLLNTRFQLSSDEITTTFSTVFKAEIDAPGFPDGIPWRSLQAQFREHKQNDNIGWLKITQPESWETELASRDVLIQRIQDCLPTNAAKRADRQTPERARSTSPEPPAVSARRKRGRDVLELDDSDEEPPTPSKSSRSGSVVVLRSECQAAKSTIADLRARGILNGLTPEPESEPELEHQTPKRNPTGTASKPMIIGLQTTPATIRFVRKSGPALDVTPKVHAELMQGYFPPSDREAHPALGGILYRHVSHLVHSFARHADTD